MGFYEELERGLLEAIEMEKGNIPVVEKPGMPVPTFVAADVEKELIDRIVEIRKEQNISQEQLAEKTGMKQQAISRFEKKENSPSLKFFANIAYALGYEIQMVKMM